MYTRNISHFLNISYISLSRVHLSVAITIEKDIFIIRLLFCEAEDFIFI